MSTHIARIVGEEGLEGRITDQLRDADGVPYVFVEFTNGERARIPMALLRPQADGSAYVALRPADLLRADAAASGERIVVPVIAEELQVGKRTIETGRVRVHKVVHEREELVDEPLFRETVEVKRVTLNRPIDLPPEVRREGETVIVPIVEEVLVVEKRLVLKEELHITRSQSTVHAPQTFTLKSEEVVVDHLPPSDESGATARE